MTKILESTSTLLTKQLPEFVVEDNPNFVAFVKAYYEWMETNGEANSGSVLYHTKNLLKYKDIDTTPTDDFINQYTGSVDNFINYFRNDFLPYFPNDTLVDQKKLIKAAREFYNKKGSEESIKFLFRILYNKDIQISYPKENILKTSDGKWQIPQAVKLILSPENLYFDVANLNNRQGIGSVSNATCKIETATKTVDKGINREVVEVYISNVDKLFSAGENLEVSGFYPGNNAPFTFSEKIIGSISNLKINPKNQGLKYNGAVKDATTGKYIYLGDPVVIYGGLDNTVDATKAIAYVNNVTTGQIRTIQTIKGGFGFTPFPNSDVTVISDSGTGANVIVQSITGTYNVSVCTDSIEFKKNVTLTNPNYSFDNATAHLISANINSRLNQAFSYINVTAGAISTMNVVNGGAGFRSVPSYDILSRYETDLSADYAGSSLAADISNHANTVQSLQDLGVIANVTIASGGTGYSGSDTVVVNSAYGYGAQFSLTVNGSGSITGVTVTNGGEGYPHPIANLTLSVATSTGSNAQLIAYGYSEGEELSTTVSDIGRIIDFRIQNRGFDYISRPNVSLRILDVNVSTSFSPEDILTISEDSVIYQGDSYETKTFSAKLDKVGSNLSDTEPSFLRLYNYTGSINRFQNLVILDTELTATPNSSSPLIVKVYGNGTAKANAEFLNGLINYDGFYLNTDGQLSADQYLQNYTKYHNFSYVIQVDKSINDFRNTLFNLAHPAGMQMLADMIVQDEKKIMELASQDVSIISSITGSLTANAFWANANVQGFGTNFTSNANVGDLLIINSTNDSRTQVKQIIQIPSDTMITLESNTRFFGPGTLSATASSNTLSISTNIYDVILKYDYVRFKLNDTTFLAQIVDDPVTGAESSTIQISTPAASIIEDWSDMAYYVYPKMDAVSYEIINQ